MLRALTPFLIPAAVVLSLGAVGLTAMTLGQRSFIYFPSHRIVSTELVPWRGADRDVWGYARPVESPRAVWLMLHGNAGQAADRGYAMKRTSANDAFYVLEYPGYGQRPGKPSRATIDLAAAEAYGWLRARYPGRPICVLGESLGSGPAASLARQPVPPDKIVLVVPFDTFAAVAARHMPYVPVRWLLRDRWDNLHALQGYRGQVEIFAARDDRIIPYEHAERLARSLPGARFTLLNGGHNDWSVQPNLRLDP